MSLKRQNTRTKTKTINLENGTSLTNDTRSKSSKQRWPIQDDVLLIEAVRLYPNSWSQVALYLSEKNMKVPNHTNRQCESRFSTLKGKGMNMFH